MRFVAGNVDVNTLASKRSELLGNADILRMRRVIHNNSTCVCLRIPVAAITQKRKNASVDLWPALDNAIHTHNGHGLISRLKNKMFTYIAIGSSKYC